MNFQTVQLDQLRELLQRNSVRGANGCLEWTGLRDEQGYGRVYVGNGKVQLAHRVSWTVHRGPIPTGGCILHHCDNPPCIDDAHLFLGSRADNVRDMAKKGRQWLQKRPECRPVCPDHLKARGEKHHSAKLTADQVLEIRHRFAAGAVKRHLAREFGVSENNIGSIISGALWGHIGGPLSPKGSSRRIAS